jgi:hypothetical protein
MTGFLPNDEAKHCNGISSEEFQASRHSSLIAEKSVKSHEILNTVIDIMKELSLKGTREGFPLSHWQDRLGVHGFAAVFDEVPTLHVKHGIPVPPYHLIVLGLVKDFLKYIWDGHSSKKTSDSRGRSMRLENKALVLRLEEGIFLNNTFNRPYSSIALCSSWIFEEVTAFVKVHSCMLFNEDVTGVKVLTPSERESTGGVESPETHLYALHGSFRRSFREATIRRSIKMASRVWQNMPRGGSF